MLFMPLFQMSAVSLVCYPYLQLN
uniref:Uncharacterized protein n=1 Tax=Anguilla anguilla TaxID=7936 RepID=A0A0E9P913_ANGAN